MVKAIAIIAAGLFLPLLSPDGARAQSSIPGGGVIPPPVVSAAQLAICQDDLAVIRASAEVSAAAQSQTTLIAGREIARMRLENARLQAELAEAKAKIK